MTLKLSTGLRNSVLVTNSLKGLLTAGFIKIYAGTVPADADAALGGATLLCTISNDATGTGLTFESAASAGVMTKAAAEIWRGVNVASGVATFFRFIAVGDDGTSSTSQVRMQGNVATAGSDMNVSSTSLVSAASQSIDFFTVALPALA